MKEILSEQQLQAVRKFLKKQQKIIACYLFGSRVSASSHPKSDLDIGVLCVDKKGISPVEIAINLSKSIPDYQPDASILDLNDDPLVLIRVINGMLVYQKSLAERIALETRILHLYEDYRHLRSISNYYLNKSFREGIYAD